MVRARPGAGLATEQSAGRRTLPALAHRRSVLSKPLLAAPRHQGGMLQVETFQHNRGTASRWQLAPGPQQEAAEPATPCTHLGKAGRVGQGGGGAGDDEALERPVLAALLAHVLFCCVGAQKRVVCNRVCCVFWSTGRGCGCAWAEGGRGFHQCGRERVGA